MYEPDLYCYEQLRNTNLCNPPELAKEILIKSAFPQTTFRKIDINYEIKNMNQKKPSLTVNFIMNTILSMSSFIFPLITFPYVSRVLLPVGTGRVSFATSVITYFAMFAQLGIPTYGIRACARVRDDREKLTRTVQEIFIINLIMTILTYLVFLVTLFTVPKFQSEKTLLLIISTTMVFNLIGMEWLYKGLEQYSYITIRSIIFKFIAVIAMFVLIHKQEDYVIYGAITIFAASASSVCNFIHGHRYISYQPIGNYNLKQHLKAVVIFFAMSCATTVYLNLDTVMLGFMKTDADVGYYNAAVKIKTILTTVVTSLGAVLLPRVSYYVEQGLMDKFMEISKKAINFVFLISLPMTIYFILFAKEGIYFLSGNAYAGSILPMQIIMPTIFFIGLTNIMGIQMLVPLGKEKIVLISEVAGAIVDLLINLILIPKYASAGAAIGTLVAEAVVWIVQYAMLRDTVKEAYRQIQYLPILIACVLSVAASLWVKLLPLDSLPFGDFITLVISAILFFAVYLLALTFFKEKLVLELENQMLRKLKHKKE